MVQLTYVITIVILSALSQVRCLLVQELKCRNGETFWQLWSSNMSSLANVCDGLTVTITNNDGKVIPELRNNSATATLRVDWSNISPRVKRKGIESTAAYAISGILLINTWDVTSRISNLSIIGSSFDFALDRQATQLNASLHGCGSFYLRATLYLTTSLSNPALEEWISYKSAPIQVVCNQQNVDLVLDVKWAAMGANKSYDNIPTLIPGKTTLRDAMSNLSITIRNPRGPALVTRTPLDELKLWVYLRKMSTDTITLGTVPIEVTQSRLGDIILRNGGTGISAVPVNASIELFNLYGLIVPKPYLCGMAAIVIRLDPFAEIPDSNMQNNIAIIPVTVDCWGSPDLMGARIGTCMVVPEEINDGKRAWFYTAGIPYGYGEFKAYEYKTDDRTFKKLTVLDNDDVNAALTTYWDLQSESSKIDCPTNTLEMDSSTSTVDGLGQLVSKIRAKFATQSLMNNWQISEQQRIGTVLQAVSGLLTAAGVNGQGLMQQFMDGALGMFFNNMMMNPGMSPGYDPGYDNSTSRNGSRGEAEWAQYPGQNYHAMLAQTLSMYMSLPEWPLPFPNSQLAKALPKFFNQLLWAPDNLSKSTSKYSGLPADVVAVVREVLIMMLKQQLPRSFDSLEVLIPVLNVSMPDLVYGMPIDSSVVQSMIDSLYTVIEDVRRYLVNTTTTPSSSSTQSSNPTTRTLATTTIANQTTATIRANLTTIFNNATPNSTFTTTALPANGTTRANSTTSFFNVANLTTTPSTTTRFNYTSPSNTSSTPASPATGTTTMANLTTRNFTVTNLTTTPSTTTGFNNTSPSNTFSTPTSPATGTTMMANLTTRNFNVTNVPMANITTFQRFEADLIIYQLRFLMNLGESGLLDKFTVLSAFVDSFRDSATVTQLTTLIRQVQSSMALRDQWMLSEGMFARVPQELLCRRQATMDRILRNYGPSFVSARPTYWRADDTTSSIHRGDLSMITGRTYWTKVAVCSCESSNSGTYMAYDPMNPGQSSGNLGAKPPK